MKKRVKRWRVPAWMVLLLILAAGALIYALSNGLLVLKPGDDQGTVVTQEQVEAAPGSAEEALRHDLAQWVQVLHYETRQSEGTRQVTAMVRVPDYPGLLMTSCGKVAGRGSDDLEKQMEQALDEFRKLLQDSVPEQSMQVTLTMPETNVSAKEMEAAIRQEAMLQMMSEAYGAIMLSAAPEIDEMGK